MSFKSSMAPHQMVSKAWPRLRDKLIAFRASLLCGLLLLSSLAETIQCQQTTRDSEAPKKLDKQPHNAVQPKAAIRFDNTITASRIDFRLTNSLSPKRYSIETMGGGVAVFDYNNDGLLDVFFTNGAEISSLEKTSPQYYNRLYRNNGDGTFTDVTEKAGLQGIGYSMGVAAGDYDNDGFVDLYVGGVNQNQLFHNNGDGTFTDVTEKAGVGGIIPKYGKAWSNAAGWFDYNNDGLLDLFVVNYLNYSIKTAALCREQGLPAYCSPVDFLGM